MAETDVNPELVKKIVKQVLAQSDNGGDSTKKIFAFSIRKDEEPGYTLSGMDRDSMPDFFIRRL